MERAVQRAGVAGYAAPREARPAQGVRTARAERVDSTAPVAWGGVLLPGVPDAEEGPQPEGPAAGVVLQRVARPDVVAAAERRRQRLRGAAGVLRAPAGPRRADRLAAAPFSRRHSAPRPAESLVHERARSVRTEPST